jgi:hypothetical protein
MENGKLPAFSVALADNGNALHKEAKGLTKRELFSLELTKATVIGVYSNSETNTWHGWTDEAFANEGIKLADALLKQLDQ